MSILWVWMNGEHVGVWQRGRAGAHRLTYTAEWVASERARPLSLSLSLTPDRTVHGAVVAHYFDNLLPDDERIRRRVATRFRTGSTEAFDLLQAIGRECVGAVQLLPPEVPPDGFDRVAGTPLSEAEVAQHLRGVTQENVLGQQEEAPDFRISIAGAQEKTALLWHRGQWHRPVGATPTTHLLKLPLGLVGGRQLDLRHSVQNEWLCARLLRALGLPVARTEMARFEGQDVLVVERFDRQWAKTAGTRGKDWIVRLPQEDFCQATGRPPSHKYESSGGPGMAQGLELLRLSDHAAADVTTFLLTQLAFWLLAATDGHGKNFSLFLLPGGRHRMTPLYDVLSLWPVVGGGAHHVPWQRAKLAMAVRVKNAHYTLASIQTRHWQYLAERAGVPGVWHAMQAMVNCVDLAIETVQGELPGDFPARTAQAIFAGMRRLATQWLRGLA